MGNGGRSGVSARAHPRLYTMAFLALVSIGFATVPIGLRKKAGADAMTPASRRNRSKGAGAAL
jgi:hypothetical protein